MHELDTRKARKPTPPPNLECCEEPECESGLRNNYYKGKRLSPASFQVEQGFFLERRRLVNRAVHGWGVVYGFTVKAAEPDECRNETASGRLEVGPGLAFDSCGRELVEVRARELDLDSVHFLTDKGALTDRQSAWQRAEEIKRKSTQFEVCWLLRAHYAERPTDPVTVSDPCSCERNEWDRTCETVSYSLEPVDCKECCEHPACELECECGTGPCCEEPRREPEPQTGHEASRSRRVFPPRKRGGCRCLCDHLMNLEQECKCDTLCEVEEPCFHVRADFRHGVPLACVRVIEDECGELAFGTEVEPCGPRRLVKRNDLLFDLIQGCDLTKIEKIGWQRWHRSQPEVPFDDFSAALGPDGEGESEYVTGDFWVRFSRPVRKETVLPDCVSMTIMSAEGGGEGGWWQTARVPILRLETLADDGDPPDHVSGFRIVVEGGWLEDAVRGRKTVFRSDSTRIEIEVRGDLILDCNGQAIDANSFGLAPGPTGNGSPGGTFFSSFRVARDRERDVDHGISSRRRGGLS